ncbi:homocysteine S-methyltransferase family protein, partial [Acinetobacter baumannii]
MRAAHQAYFDAGADFVETNTFAANRLRLEEFDLDARAVCLAGAKLAREVAGTERLVLGAIGPCGRALEP